MHPHTCGNRLVHILSETSSPGALMDENGMDGIFSGSILRALFWGRPARKRNRGGWGGVSIACLAT